MGNSDLKEFIYYRCESDHSGSSIYSRTGNSIYENNKLIVTYDLEANAIADLVRRQKYEHLKYFKFPQSKESELKVDGKLYCPFHAIIMKYKKDKKTEKRYNDFIDMFRSTVSGSKTIEF